MDRQKGSTKATGRRDGLPGGSQRGGEVPPIPPASRGRAEARPAPENAHADSVHADEVVEVDALAQRRERADSASAVEIATQLYSDDPEPVKLLKRELAVALQDEDYAAAARIRDHPFMQIMAQMNEAVLAGDDQRYQSLEARLELVIMEAEQDNRRALRNRKVY